MRFAVALCLALAACSSDPATPADVPGADAVDVAAVADAPGDAVDVAEDRPAPMDAGEDVGFDAGWIEDVGTDKDAVDAGALDAVDAGADVAAVVDVADAVDVVDAGADAVDAPGVDVVDVQAVDVPRDAGPTDGGPVVWDLAAGRGAPSYGVNARQTYASGASEDCIAPPTEPSCSVTRGVLAFSIRACGVYLTGSLAIGTASPRTLSIFAGGGGSSATTLRLTAGPRMAGSPARQSFHVQAGAAPFQGEPGLSGIPGRTIDPALADLWLLGCASD